MPVSHTSMPRLCHSSNIFAYDDNWEEHRDGLAIDRCDSVMMSNPSSSRSDAARNQYMLRRGGNQNLERSRTNLMDYNCYVPGIYLCDGPSTSGVIRDISRNERMNGKVLIDAQQWCGNSVEESCDRNVHQFYLEEEKDKMSHYNSFARNDSCGANSNCGINRNCHLHLEKKNEECSKIGIDLAVGGCTDSTYPRNGNNLSYTTANSNQSNYYGENAACSSSSEANTSGTRHQVYLTDDGHSTDFSRFKESAPRAHELFTPKLWKSLEKNDLDSFSKHLEILDIPHNASAGIFATSKKRKQGSSFSNSEMIVENGVGTWCGPCKKPRSIDDNNYNGFETITSDKLKNGNDSGIVKKKASASKICEPSYKIPDKCYVALDCEMVGTGHKGSRSVLGRCSIVDYDGTVLYDKYVLPLEPITDYRSRWSGIRPQHMSRAEPMEKAVRDIHQCVKNKVVIGHSVHHDFQVIHFQPHHYLVRDTARCQWLSRKAGLLSPGQGNSLKSLTKKIFGKEIQMSRNGHDSVEDARATLELFKIVRKDWERQLYDSWRQEGLNVEDFISSLKDGLEYQDIRGRFIIRRDEYGNVNGCAICNGDLVNVSRDMQCCCSRLTDKNGCGGNLSISDTVCKCKVPGCNNINTGNGNKSDKNRASMSSDNGNGGNDSDKNRAALSSGSSAMGSDGAFSDGCSSGMYKTLCIQGERRDSREHFYPMKMEQRDVSHYLSDEFWPSTL